MNNNEMSPERFQYLLENQSQWCLEYNQRKLAYKIAKKRNENARFRESQKKAKAQAS